MLDTHPIDNTAVVQVELPNFDQSRKQTCSSCAVHIDRSLSHGSCPGLDMCIQCFTYAVDESQGIGSASMQSMLTCSSFLVELEPSYVHEILAVHHAVSASGRYSWLLPTRNTRTITIKVHFMLMMGFSQLLPLWSGWEAKRDPLLKTDCALSGSAHLFLYLLMIILSWCVHGLLANDAQHLVILL
jgi:hypothetical protein